MAEEGAVVPDEGGEEVEETPPPAPKYALELAAAGAAGAAAWALGAEPADGYVRALFFFFGLVKASARAWGGAERTRARWAPRGAAGRGGGSRSHFVLHFEAGRECARAESEEAWRGEPLPALRRARVRALVQFFFLCLESPQTLV